MIDLAGKRAFVTGGGRGIGRATALLLARAGAKVAVGYQNRKPEPDALIAAAIAGDLGEPGVARRAVAEVMRTLGGLDILVVNHGVWPPDDVPLSQMTDAQWEGTRRANLDAAMYVCRAAIPNLTVGGTIVLVSSTAGQRGEALHADVLVIPHHGSKTSSTDRFIEAVSPKVGVLSVGYMNRFHHPNAAVVARYVSRGIPLERTDARGALHIVLLASGAGAPEVTGQEAGCRYWSERCATSGTSR